MMTAACWEAMPSRAIKLVDTYSRDSLASPLFELAQLLVYVREGTFRPDESRSGRWTSLPGDHPGTLADCGSCHIPIFRSRVFTCDCRELIHADDECRRVCPACEAEFGIVCSCLENHICCRPAAQAPCRAYESDALTGTEDDSDGDLAITAVEEADAESSRAKLLAATWPKDLPSAMMQSCPL